MEALKKKQKTVRLWSKLDGLPKKWRNLEHPELKLDYLGDEYPPNPIDFITLGTFFEVIGEGSPQYEETQLKNKGLTSWRVECKVMNHTSSGEAKVKRLAKWISSVRMLKEMSIKNVDVATTLASFKKGSFCRWKIRRTLKLKRLNKESKAQQGCAKSNIEIPADPGQNENIGSNSILEITADTSSPDVLPTIGQPQPTLPPLKPSSTATLSISATDKWFEDRTGSRSEDDPTILPPLRSTLADLCKEFMADEPKDLLDLLKQVVIHINGRERFWFENFNKQGTTKADDIWCVTCTTSSVSYTAEANQFIEAKYLSVAGILRSMNLTKEIILERKEAVREAREDIEAARARGKARRRKEAKARGKARRRESAKREAARRERDSRTPDHKTTQQHGITSLAKDYMANIGEKKDRLKVICEGIISGEYNYNVEVNESLKYSGQQALLKRKSQTLLKRKLPTEWDEMRPAVSAVPLTESLEAERSSTEDNTIIRSTDDTNLIILTLGDSQEDAGNY